MDLFEIVMKLNGPVQPQGCSQTDSVRLENMKTLIDLTDRLLSEIDRAIPAKRRQQHSMKVIGEAASDFFDSLGIEE